MGRVPPKGAGEVRYNLPFYRYFAANSYCGNTSSVFFIALRGDEKSTFPKGEGMGCFRTSAIDEKEPLDFSSGSHHLIVEFHTSSGY